MSTSKHIDKICCTALAFVIILTAVFVNAGQYGLTAVSSGMGYEQRLFDTTKVHTIDIVMDDWEGFLDTCENEEYELCAAVIDGEAFKNVGIRAKGNTSLSMVSQYGNNRYSFKIEFDHYDNTKTYYGLDKLSLNNIIQDHTYMKDYLCYQMMGYFGVNAPLCSYVSITVNGEAWGLYLAVEGVEESFLERNFGSDYGQLYKPDNMDMGGGKGNGGGFQMDHFQKERASSDETEPSDETEIPEGMQPPNETEIPEGMQPPDETEIPEGAQPPNETEFSEIMQPPNETEFSEGMQPPNETEIPEGMQPPNETDIPEGMQPPTEIEFPEEMQSSDRENFPEGMQPRDEISLPEDLEEENASENRKMPTKPNIEGGFPNGHMNGRKSEDVSLIYTDDNPKSYSNIFDNAKTDVTDADQARLIRSLKSLNEEKDLTEVVNVDEVIRYFVIHNFVCNFDSYTGSMIHNYYLYEEDGQMSMIPWDYNLAFGGFQSETDASGLVNYPIDTPVSGGDTDSRPMLAWILNNEQYKETYHQYFAEFIADYFESGYFAEMIDTVSAMIAPYVKEDPTKFCTYEQFETGIDVLKQFCLLRAESIAGQVEGTIPSTEEGQKQETSALIDASSITVSDMGSMGRGMGDKTRQKGA